MGVDRRGRAGVGVDQAQTLTIRAISPAEALAGLGDMSQLDPRGAMTADDMRALVEGGRCFALDSASGAAVWVLRDLGAVCWVDAMRGAGSLDLTDIADKVMTEQARGFEALAMQTARPGLRRKLERKGWRVTGWIMRKDLKND